MAYFLNTNINTNKKTSIALCTIFGIGKTLSKKICNTLGLNENVKFFQLNNAQLEKISELINDFFDFGNEYKQVLQNNKKRLIKISTYRGFRHKQKLPCRGQRTHTNAVNASVCGKNY